MDCYQRAVGEELLLRLVLGLALQKDYCLGEVALALGVFLRLELPELVVVLEPDAEQLDAAQWRLLLNQVDCECSHRAVRSQHQSLPELALPSLRLPF
jgi:hypothetical protein